MNAIWHKVYADLFEHQARTLLGVFSIAAGLAAVGVLFGMVDMQLSAMDKAHGLARPSHINLILSQPVDRSAIAQLAALDGVESVEPMHQITVRYKLSDAEAWKLATLVMRADYAAQRYDLIDLVDGRWPSGGNLGVERLSARALGLANGGSVILDGKDGTIRLPITGTLRHPFVKPPRFGGQAHFFADAATLEDFGVPQGHYRQLLVRAAGAYDADKVRALATRIRATLGRAGIGVNVALLQDPARHWGRPFVAGIDSVIQVMAVVSLFLGSLLILETTTTRIAQQTHQIGIMKSLGGGRRAIATAYLAEVLVMGLAAIVIALPLSLAGAWLATRWLLDLFNISFDAFDFSGQAVWWVVGGGVVMPLLAASWPIYRGVSSSVRAAISSYGVGGDYRAGRFDGWVEQLSALLLPTLYATAMVNLFRRKGRLVLTEAGLITAGVMFLVVTSLASSVNLTLDREMARTAYDVRIGFAADQPVARIEALMAGHPEVRRFETWYRSPADLSTQGQSLRHTGSLGAQVIGVPAGSRMYRPLIVDGRWLTEDEGEPRALVLNAETAEHSGVAVGDSVTVNLPGGNTAAWRVVGLYRWIAGSNYAVEPVYAPLAALRQATGKQALASQLLVGADVPDRDAEAALADSLKADLEQAGIPLDFYTTTARLEQRGYARNQFRPVLSMLLGLAAMVATVGGIGLSGALSIAIMQRRREIGILRAIGAGSRAIFAVFLLEGVLQALLAWALSVPLAYVLAEPLARRLGRIMFHLELDYAFELQPVMVWLAVVLAVALLACVGPARGAARLSVRDCLDRAA